MTERSKYACAVGINTSTCAKFMVSVRQERYQAVLDLEIERQSYSHSVKRICNIHSSIVDATLTNNGTAGKCSFAWVHGLGPGGWRLHFGTTATPEVLTTILTLSYCALASSSLLV